MEELENTLKRMHELSESDSVDRLIKELAQQAFKYMVRPTLGQTVLVSHSEQAQEQIMAILKTVHGFMHPDEDIFKELMQEVINSVDGASERDEQEQEQLAHTVISMATAVAIYQMLHPESEE